MDVDGAGQTGLPIPEQHGGKPEIDVPRPLSIINRCQNIIPEDRKHGKFLFNITSYPASSLASAQSGTVFPQLSPFCHRNLRQNCPLPPPSAHRPFHLQFTPMFFQRKRLFIVLILLFICLFMYLFIYFFVLEENVAHVRNYPQKRGKVARQ